MGTLRLGLGSAGGEVWAQYSPPLRGYRPKVYPPPKESPPRQPLPPVADADDDVPPLNAPVLQGPALPPLGVGPQSSSSSSSSLGSRGGVVLPMPLRIWSMRLAHFCSKRL